MNVGKPVDVVMDLACWRKYMASGFHMLAIEAVVSQFFDIALGYWPREAGEDYR